MAIHREYVQGPSSDEKSNSGTRGGSEDQSDSIDSTDLKVDNANVDLDDKKLLKKARRASNGPKFERLWAGNTGGYESNSEADMALCCLLAFWSGGDQKQMDRLLRQSGLLREKWDEVHYADGSTYGEKTIERAVENTSNFYSPNARRKTEQSQIESQSSVDTGVDDSTRRQAHLIEKNRLLADRVDELELLLEQKNERIDALEAEIEQSTNEHAARDHPIEQAQDAHAESVSENNPETATPSLWERIVGRRSE